MKRVFSIPAYLLWVAVCVSMLSAVSCRKVETDIKRKGPQLAANKTSEYDDFMADSVKHRHMLAITAKALSYLSQNENFNSSLISNLGGVNMVDHSIQLRTLKQQLGNSTYVLYFDSAFTHVGLGEEDRAFFYNNDDSISIGGQTTYPAIYVPGLIEEYQAFNDGWNGRFPTRIYTSQQNMPQYPNANDEFDIPAYYIEGGNLTTTSVSNQNLMSLRGWQVFLDIVPSIKSTGDWELFSREIYYAGRITGQDCHCEIPGGGACFHGPLAAGQMGAGCGKDRDGCGCPPPPPPCQHPTI